MYRYYTRINWQDASEDDLFEATRRLVFNAVDDNLFRSYQDVDPSLSRLIRNLKLAILKMDGISVTRLSGHLWMHLEDGPVGSHQLPVMPPEFLEMHLSQYIGRVSDTLEIVTAVIRIFKSQSLYRRAFPLTMLARIIRSASVHVQDEETTDQVPSILPDELECMIIRSITSLRSSMWPNYVEKGKVSADTFDAYCQAIRHQLLTHLVYDGEALTNYHALSVYLPGLSREDYIRKHRSILEYLARTVRKELKQVYAFAQGVS